MPGLKKFSDVDVTDIEGVSSASSIAGISGVDLFGLPLILRLTIAADGNSWDPTIKMNNGLGVIDWGDGTPTESVSIVDLPPHTYSTAGTYDVTLSPFKSSLTRTVGFGVQDSQVTEVLAFGDCGSVSFTNWESLVTIPLNGYLDLTGVVFFRNSIFQNCSDFVGPTSMSGYASLGTTSSLGLSFQGAPLFNGPGLNDLDTSSVINLSLVFTGASAFDQPLDNWVVSGVTNMFGMFDGASAFDQDIGGWDVSLVSNMSIMFRGASSFNQDISGWDVSSVNTMTTMFNGANSFDQNLGAWRFKNNADCRFFLLSSGISDANVALCLEGWDSVGQGTGVDMSNVVSRTLSESTYPNAKAAYDNLIATYSWDLTNAITWVGPLPLFLDAFPNAAAAYSVRLLRTGYVGSAMRVRRAVTPFDEQDIGFTPGGDLDEAAIVAFGGSDELRVSKWYDQSGQSKDVEQITPTAQPQIYNGVSVVQDNGRAALQLSGAQGLNCSTNTRTTQGPSTVIQVRNAPKQAGFQQPVGFYRVQRHVIERVGQSTYDDVSIGTAWANGEYLRYPNANVTTQLLHISSWDGSTQTGGRDLIQLFENGGAAESSLVGTGGFGVPVSGDNSIGWRHATSSQGCTGYFQEVIIYPSDESFYRVDMANNIMTHFNIP